jgi:hypothetical protein
MKGLVIFILSMVVTFSAFAGSIKASDLVAIKLTSSELIKDLSLQESTKVLKSLEKDQNIEIRNRVIYPEEVAQLITRKLTNGRNSGKRPNPNDYN